jgi:hypothetical protein
MRRALSRSTRIAGFSVEVGRGGAGGAAAAGAAPGAMRANATAGSPGGVGANPTAGWAGGVGAGADTAFHTASASSLPAPHSIAGPLTWVACCLSRSRALSAVSAGFFCSISAITPATCGAAMLVPLSVW